MAFKAIQLYIASDVASSVVTTASGVQAANSDLWPTVSQVPPYAYKSLGEIWIGVSAASGTLLNRVVYKLGENLEASVGEISLLGDEIESVDVSNDGLQTNEPGGETMFVDIVLRLPEERQNWDTMQQADLRLRYLLDENWRARRHRVSRYIPNLGDNTVGGNVRLRWIRHLVPPNAKEVWSRYMVAYTRSVPR